MKDKTKVAYKTSALKTSLHVTSSMTFFLCFFLLFYKLGIHFSVFWILPLIIGFIFGQLVADFLGGLVHWGFDTWGKAQGSIFSRSIRAFREHHIDEFEITRHSFWVASGQSGILVIPVQLWALWLPLASTFSIFLFCFLFFLTGASFYTNLFHKWAHMPNPPLVARVLQKYRIILAPEKHHIHHLEPFNSSYCITNGWMNPILKKIGFFRRVEKIIYRITGIIPRADDIGEEAALKLLGGE